MRTVNVDLGSRSYPIYIGSGLLNKPELLSPYIKGRQVCIVTNDTVASLYLEPLQKALEGYQVSCVQLPDGESFKTLQVLSTIFDRLLEDGHNRTTTIIALGGGVVGDMAGYAAASYQRGVDFIQVPTTLLAQVDSSVGGKTGVNHPKGKNMIGAFHQPNAVLIDTDVLATLPNRELSAGIAEVIKYGLIADAEFFQWLEANTEKLVNRDTAALEYAIERSCQNKASVVARDEREGGVRAILNLGHTFGHAIETREGYGEWLHGEAVAAGMMMALDLSVRQGWVEIALLQRLRMLLEVAELPTAAPDGMTAEEFQKLMSIDKKVIDGQLRLVLLKALGQAVTTSDFSTQLLMQTLEQDALEAL